jgi:type VI secretion system secreted protein Hcp
MSEYSPRDFVDNVQALTQSDCYLELKANGTQIKGGVITESKDTPIDIKGLIKITQWENRVSTAREAGSGMATGRRKYEGLQLIGPISQAAPLLFKALVENQVVEGTLKNFRLKKDGKKENHFNIKFTNGRLGNYNVFTSPLDGSLYYQFAVVFHHIEYEWTEGGVVHEDDVQQNA